MPITCGEDVVCRYGTDSPKSCARAIGVLQAGETLPDHLCEETARESCEKWLQDPTTSFAYRRRELIDPEDNWWPYPIIDGELERDYLLGAVIRQWVENPIPTPEEALPVWGALLPELLAARAGKAPDRAGIEAALHRYELPATDNNVAYALQYVEGACESVEFKQAVLVTVLGYLTKEYEEIEGVEWEFYRHSHAEYQFHTPRFGADWDWMKPAAAAVKRAQVILGGLRLKTCGRPTKAEFHALACRVWEGTAKREDLYAQLHTHYVELNQGTGSTREDIHRSTMAAVRSYISRNRPKNTVP